MFVLTFNFSVFQGLKETLAMMDIEMPRMENWYVMFINQIF